MNFICIAKLKECMDANIIRAIIFFVAGLITILFAKKVYKFQMHLIEKLRIKYNIEKELKYYPYLGILFITISIILLIVSLTN